MMTDEDMPEALHNWLLCQTKEKLLEVMFEALELMQGYNGRSLRYCIATAAGFEEKANGGWKIPKVVPPIVPGASYWLNCAKEQLSVINDSVFELKGKAISVDRQYVLLARIIGATESAIRRISEHEEKAR